MVDNVEGFAGAKPPKSNPSSVVLDSNVEENTTAMNKEAINKEHQLYSTNCLQGFSRSEDLFQINFTARIKNQECIVPLPSDFQSLEIITKKHNRRCLGGNYANFSLSFLANTIHIVVGLSSSIELEELDVGVLFHSTREWPYVM